MKNKTKQIQCLVAIFFLAVGFSMMACQKECNNAMNRSGKCELVRTTFGGDICNYCGRDM